MDITPLFVAELTPLKKPAIRLVMPNSKTGVFFILKTDSLTEAQKLAEALNGAVASILRVECVPIPPD